jgi:LysR family transcriptional regulator, nitrogen assimilation regulatory protein
MELKQLQCFVNVAKAGSFTRAAAKLKILQPALSKQVRSLEVELKLPLFRRNGRGIALTEGGKVLLDHARTILADVDQAQLALDTVRSEAVGSLSIAMPLAAERFLATDFIKAFRVRFPKARLQITEGKSGAIQEWLLEDRIDIGLLHGSTVRAGTEIVRRIDQELYLVSKKNDDRVRAGAPVPFRELRKLPLILPPAPHSIRDLLHAHAARLGIKLNVVLEVDGAQFILELVQQGHGYTILPSYSFTMRSLSETLQQNEIVHPRLTRHLSVAISSQRPQTRLTRESIKLMQHYLDT